MNSRISLFIIVFLCSISCKEEATVQLGETLDDVFETKPVVTKKTKKDHCFEDQYAVASENITRKLDIVIVVDTSGSINQERSQIAKGFESFINKLPEEVDLRIGVILAHGPASNRSGQLYQKGNEPIVLSSELLSTTEIVTHLNYKMKSPHTDGDSDGGEMGVYSLTKAITDNLRAIQSQDLFRDDAALAVIFVADEQDICAKYPQGVTPVFDPDGKEVSAFSKYCIDSEGYLIYEPEQLLTDLERLQGERPIIVGGVLYNNLKTIPKGGENEIGYGYKETIELSGGLIVDLANGDYKKGLADLGKLAQVSIQPVSEFRLEGVGGKNSELDLVSLEVLINDEPAHYTYDQKLNLVSLTYGRGEFDIVSVNYCKVLSNKAEHL